MVLKRGLTGLLSDDVFFFNFSSLIGVLLVCLLAAGRPVDANRRETLLQRKHTACVINLTAHAGGHTQS